MTHLDHDRARTQPWDGHVLEADVTGSVESDRAHGGSSRRATHHVPVMLAGRSWIRLVHCAGAHRDRYLWARAGVFGASAAHVVSQVGRVTPRCGVDLQCHEVDGDVEDHVDHIEEPDDRERAYSGLGPL